MSCFPKGHVKYIPSWHLSWFLIMQLSFYVNYNYFIFHFTVNYLTIFDGLQKIDMARSHFTLNCLQKTNKLDVYRLNHYHCIWISKCLLVLSYFTNQSGLTEKETVKNWHCVLFAAAKWNPTEIPSHKWKHGLRNVNANNHLHYWIRPMASGNLEDLRGLSITTGVLKAAKKNWMLKNSIIA